MIMPMMLFGGLFANNESIPIWLRWFQYISPIKYCAEALLWNEFRNDPYELRDSLMEHLGYKLSYVKCIGIYLALIIGFRSVAFVMFKSLVKKFQ